MSRRILFYRINHTDGVTPFIENVTHVIGWLSGNLPVGEYKQGSKYEAKKRPREEWNAIVKKYRDKKRKLGLAYY